MVEYLSEYFGKWLIPSKYPAGKEGQIGQETESWMRYRFFMHYVEGSLMTILTVALIVNSKIPHGLEQTSGLIACRHQNQIPLLCPLHHERDCSSNILILP